MLNVTFTLCWLVLYQSRLVEAGSIRATFRFNAGGQSDVLQITVVITDEETVRKQATAVFVATDVHISHETQNFLFVPTKLNIFSQNMSQAQPSVFCAFKPDLNSNHNLSEIKKAKQKISTYPRFAGTFSVATEFLRLFGSFASL